jgi:hypothetical protein
MSERSFWSLGISCHLSCWVLDLPGVLSLPPSCLFLPFGLGMSFQHLTHYWVLEEANWLDSGL